MDPDAFTTEAKATQFKVKDVAMGQYHMAVLAVDAEVHREFVPQEYARDIFARLRRYLIDVRWGQVSESKAGLPESRRKAGLTDKDKIEQALEDCFRDDQQHWPFGQWLRLYDLLFHEVQLPFSENVGMATDRLQRALANPDDESMINLKELRDLIVGQRTNHGVVFAWGLDDERLCCAPAAQGMKTGLLSSTRNSSSPPSKQSLPGSKRTWIARPKVIKLPGADLAVAKVVCGNSYSLVLCENGAVYSWGIGKSGSLGLGELHTVVPSAAPGGPKLPARIRFPLSEPGDADEAPNKAKGGPGKEGAPIKIVAIASGQSHCLALTSTGAVYSWGNGQGGRLGHGDLVGKNSPEQIKALAGRQVDQIECGDAHSGAVTDSGVLYVWGVGLNGRLGTGVKMDQADPQTLMDFAAHKMQRVFFGMNTSFVVTKSDECYGWGSGQYGKLGLLNSQESQYESPRKIYTLTGENRGPLAEFAVGPCHTLALTADGRMFAFGNAKDGKLGLQLSSQQLSAAAMQNNIEQPTPLTDGPPNRFHVSRSSEQVFQKYMQFKAFTDVATLAEDPDSAN